MTIEEQLLAYFANHANAEVSPDTHLVEESVIDSMGVMELIAFIENTYHIEVDMDDLTIENFATVINIRDFIMRSRGEI